MLAFTILTSLKQQQPSVLGINVSGLQTIVVANPQEAGKQVFKCIQDMHQNKQLNTVGLATGSTMQPVYKYWREAQESYQDVVTFNLDEYVGLSAKHHQSYAYFMHQELFDHVAFKQSFLLNGIANHLQEECNAYEQALNQHPLDLQLLGVGENGHIAFNEPGVDAQSVTNITELTDSTIAVNSRFFSSDETVPSKALTMGIASILNAKKIIIVILGEKKRAALEKLYAGEVDNHWPVTYLLKHPQVIVVTDLDI